MHCRLQNGPDSFLEDLAYLTFRIFQISEFPGTSRTSFYTGRAPPLFHPMMTPAAFIRFFNLVVYESGTIGTSLNAIGTSQAIIVIDEYEAFGGFVSCTDRTDLHAGWVLAVVTHLGHKKGTLCLCLQVFTDRLESLGPTFRGIDVNAAVFGDDVPFHPGPECALRYVIFLPAGAHATTPADALVDIDNIGPVVLGAPLLPYPGCLMATAYPGGVNHQGGRATRHNLFQKYPA